MQIAGRNRRIVYAAGAGVFQRIAQAACTLLVMPLVLHALGQADFGVWGAAASLAWLAGLVDIGIGSALVTAVAEAKALHRDEDARHQVAGALAAGCGLAALILVTATAGVLAVVPRNQAGPYLIATAGLALNIPLNGANNLWMALQKGYFSGFWELIQTIVTTAGLAAAALFSRDVRVYVAVVYGSLVLANLGSLGHLLLRHPELRPHGLSHAMNAARGLVGTGLLYCALGLAAGLSFLLDNVFALHLLGPEASARMTVALRICVTALGILAVISQPLWPVFSESAMTGDMRWIRRSLLRGTALLAALAVAGAAALVGAGEPLLRWWLRADLGIGRDLLWAMAAWIVVQSLVRVPNLLLNATRVVGFQVYVCLIATAIAIALKVILAPRFGVSGILWATAATLAAIVLPAMAWRAGRWMRSRRLQAAEPASLPV